jgi:hypothetical protein
MLIQEKNVDKKKKETMNCEKWPYRLEKKHEEFCPLLSLTTPFVIAPDVPFIPHIITVRINPHPRDIHKGLITQMAGITPTP